MVFKIIIRGRNCQPYIAECLQSLENQTYKLWEPWVFLDAPEDLSKQVAANFPCTNITVHPKRLGLSHAMYYALTHIKGKQEDIVGILDADDYLRKDALAKVYKMYYKYPETLITYGSYFKLSKGNRTKISNPYLPNTKVRRDRWHGSHFKTFKYALVPHVKENWFKDTSGNWLPAASDLALMIPLMEIAGMDRCKHIHDMIYFWRDNTKYKTDVKLQKKCEEVIRCKKQEQIMRLG